MKILHTADLHLREHGDERWQALQQLLEAGKRKKIDLFAVSGDLFDRGTGLLKLQEHLRAAFSNLPFKVVVLPGNHDSAAFTTGIYLGGSAVLLNDWQNPYAHNGVMLWGLPFEPVGGMEILNRLHAMAARMSGDRRHLLLFHGELLDAYFSRRDLGEEGDERYMPVKLSYFQDLSFDCILAGHFHANFRAWTLPRRDGRDRYFVYPGSPVSVTRRETGQRKINLFELGGPPGEHDLDTFHFSEKIVTLDPFGGGDPLEQLRQELAGLHPAARLILTVTGYIDGSRGLDETALAEQVRRLAAERCAGEPRYAFRDISTVLSDGLFKAFLDRLDRVENDDPAAKTRLREMAVQAMMEAKLC